MTKNEKKIYLHIIFFCLFCFGENCMNVMSSILGVSNANPGDDRRYENYRQIELTFSENFAKWVQIFLIMVLE